MGGGPLETRYTWEYKLTLTFPIYEHSEGVTYLGDLWHRIPKLQRWELYLTKCT